MKPDHIFHLEQRYDILYPDYQPFLQRCIPPESHRILELAVDGSVNIRDIWNFPQKPGFAKSDHIQMVDDVDGMILTNPTGDFQRPPLPTAIVEIETPVALVPTHPPDPVGYRVVVEMHVLPLGQFWQGGFNPVAELPFRNDEQFTGLGQPDTPVPSQARFTSVVGRDSIGTDENLTHGTVCIMRLTDNATGRQRRERAPSSTLSPTAGSG